MASNTRVLVIATLLAITLVALFVVIAVVTPIAIVFSADTSKSDVFKLYVNPADPIIISVERPDGDTIYMLGNKTSDGLPQSINEFQIENVEGSTYVRLGTDGSIASVLNTDGLQLDFTWSGNFTMLHISLILGSEQVLININLTQPIPDNFTDFDFGENDARKKRSAESEHRVQRSKTASTKRQSENRDFASVAVSVVSCDSPQRGARVFANVLLDYDAATGNYDGSLRYTGTETKIPGQYQVRIPTSAASDISDRAEPICDLIGTLLEKVCNTYSTVIDVARLVSRRKADQFICRALVVGLTAARVPIALAVYRPCITALKVMDSYCGGTASAPANFICNNLPQIDNYVDRL